RLGPSFVLLILGVTHCGGEVFSAATDGLDAGDGAAGTTSHDGGDSGKHDGPPVDGGGGSGGAGGAGGARGAAGAAGAEVGGGRWRLGGYGRKGGERRQRGHGWNRRHRRNGWHGRDRWIRGVRRLGRKRGQFRRLRR